MTQNQLRYLDLERQKRADAANVEELGRHNLVTERLTRNANKELGRHNLVLEANQQSETAAGIKRANIAAESSKYAADANARASKYSADSSAAATRYAADTNASTSKYVADRNAQTQLTVAQINKQVQAAKDAVNKAMNDDNINAKTKQNLVKNASDQFIANMNNEMSKYSVDKKTQLEYDKLTAQLAEAIAKNANTGIISKILSSIGGIVKNRVPNSIRNRR